MYSIYCLCSTRNFFKIRYIGVTRQSLTRRLSGHLKASKINNYHINNWISKELSSGYKICIKLLEKGIRAEKAAFKEMEYILRYDNLTNISKGGNGCLGYIKTMNKKSRKGIKLTEEHKNNIRKAKLGRKHSIEHNINNRKAQINREWSISRRKPISCYSKSGEYLQTYFGIREASRCIKPNMRVEDVTSSIRKCALGISKTAYGFIFKFE